jgi:hypothetical protein
MKNTAIRKLNHELQAVKAEVLRDGETVMVFDFLDARTWEPRPQVRCVMGYESLRMMTAHLLKVVKEAGNKLMGGRSGVVMPAFKERSTDVQLAGDKVRLEIESEDAPTIAYTLNPRAAKALAHQLSIAVEGTSSGEVVH